MNKNLTLLALSAFVGAHAGSFDYNSVYSMAGQVDGSPRYEKITLQLPPLCASVAGIVPQKVVKALGTSTIQELKSADEALALAFVTLKPEFVEAANKHFKNTRPVEGRAYVDRFKAVLRNTRNARRFAGSLAAIAWLSIVPSRIIAGIKQVINSVPARTANEVPLPANEDVRSYRAIVAGAARATFSTAQASVKPALKVAATSALPTAAVLYQVKLDNETAARLDSLTTALRNSPLTTIAKDAKLQAEIDAAVQEYKDTVLTKEVSAAASTVAAQVARLRKPSGIVNMLKESWTTIKGLKDVTVLA